jgi:hypothetical protein
MNSSTYPDGILIDHVALRRTELTKAAEILRGRTDWTSRGIYSGGLITVNALDLTRIDISMLSGFVPNGEFIETDSNYFSIVLDSYVLNAVNYVVAEYCENSTYKQPHESNGTTIATCAEMAWRIRVYEESVFNALPATDPNLGNAAIDRCLIIGKVTANGPGVNLTTSNIFSPTSYSALLYSDPMTFTTIPGVTVLAVSTDTIPGTGTLEHYCLAGPVQYLRWNAPNQAAWPVVAPPGGGWQEITGDMNIDLPGSAGTFLRVQVILSMLPIVIATPIAVTADIYNLYYQEIPRLTAEDNLHRSMIGTGVITPLNPHGTSLTDISGSDLGLLNEHQDLLHSGGFVYTSSASAAQATISFPLTADMLSLVPLVGQDAYMCNGKRVTSFSPTSFMFEPAVIPTATTGTHLYEVYLSDEGVAAVHHKAMIDESGGPRTITGVWPVDMSPSYPASAGLALNLTVGATTLSYSFNGGEVVIVPFASASQVIRLYDYTSEGWLDLLVNTPAPPVGGGDVALSPDANSPGVGVYVDSLIVYASPDWTQNIQIASVVGWLDALAAPPRFAIGYKPYQGGTRSVVDKRARGTLAVENISDSALQTLVYSPEDELHESGVLYRRNTTAYDFAYYGAAGLTLNFRGGGYYCRGKRIDYAGSAQTLYDNEINLIYLDAGGTMRILPVTADFAGSIPDAVNYVIGSTKLTPWVSSVFEGTDATDAPERGVVLYSIVTAGGAISSYTNLMRNINGPPENWSVASFTASDALAAFDSLYSAFLYAGLRTLRDYTIEVLLTGPSTIDATITQPSNVNVRGKNNSTAISVTINAVDASGAWRLASGSKISDAQIYMNVDSGAAIGLHNNVTVERCIYFVNVGLTNDIFLYAGAAYSNVHVTGNKVTTRSSLITGTNASNYSWWVENNTVTQSPNSIASSLIKLYGKNIHIKNNKLITDNSITATPAISGTLSGEYLVDGNDIELGTSADAAFNYGIYLDANTSYTPRIINNTITRTVGSVSHVGVGIDVRNGAAHISGNRLVSMGGGIRVLSNTISGLQIENNFIERCYHMGIAIGLATGGGAAWSIFDGVSIRGNVIKGMSKDAGGAGIFGVDLYGIVVLGLIKTSMVAGNMSVTGNNVSTLSSSLGAVYGIRSYLDIDTAAGGLLAGYEGISLNDNVVKDAATSGGGGSTYGISAEFIAAAAGGASILSCRAISVSNNNVKGILSIDEDAYGIFTQFNLDTTHTTGLNGLAVNGNNVSGFWGDLTDTTSVSAGIHLEDSDIVDEVWAVTCNNNNVASNSVMIAGAVDNDATFVYGIYSNLGNTVVSNNNITFTGLLPTVRGDGIRIFPKSASAPNLRSNICGNNIDVGWTGIHVKSDITASIFNISNNRINSKSLGIYLAANVSYSSISGNSIFVTPSNTCDYAACTLTGGACIAGATTWPRQTSITGNSLTLAGSLAAASANLWLYQAEGIAFDNNLTYKAGGVVGSVFHVFAYDCRGACSISGNTVDNSVLAGTHGIYVESVADVPTIMCVTGNKILCSNSAVVEELHVIYAVGALSTNRMYVTHNRLHLMNGLVAELPFYVLDDLYYIIGGGIVNELHSRTTGAEYIYTNIASSNVVAVPVWF